MHEGTLSETAGSQTASPRQPAKLVLTASQKWAKKYSLLALVCMIVGSLGLDQLTKVTAEKNLLVWQDTENLKEYQGQRLPVWAIGERASSLDAPKFYLSFSFNYVRNQGAAWGFLSDWQDNLRVPFFYAITFIAVIVILLYLKTTPLSHRLARFALALILSGALGNFIDRILRGYVIDFLDFRWVIPLPFTVDLSLVLFPPSLDFLNIDIYSNAWRYNFPNFNWADSAITVGVVLLIFDMLVLESLRKRRLHADSHLTSEKTPNCCS